MEGFSAPNAATNTYVVRMFGTYKNKEEALQTDVDGFNATGFNQLFLHEHMERQLLRSIFVM